MVAVLTGRLGGPRVGEGDLPGGGALVGGSVTAGLSTR
jgi:hypothetical protein